MQRRALPNKAPSLTRCSVLLCSTVFLGDVVVLASPLSAPPELLVRRVTALEGDEMVSDLPGDVDFRYAPERLS